WLAREWVTKLIRDLGPSPTPASVQDALREALDDPTLRLLYRVGGDYVDVDGAPQPASEWHDPRVAVVNPGSSAAVLLIAGPVLVRYHDLVHAAARVAGLALENTSLQAAVSAQIHSVSRSAQRLATAVDAEHRSVQATVRQICDGELAALADQLDTLGRISDTAGLAVQVESARAMLGQARQELTCLAEGVGPAELSQLGLARAVAAAAHRLSPEIAVSVTSAPLDAEIQAAAYLVLAELMTNAVKHAPGSAVTARATLAGSGLLIEVADDGPGGADPGGSGLRGIAERVTSLSGSLTVGSPQGHGTRVTLWLPGAGDCRRAGDLPPPTGYPEDRPHPAYRAPGLLVGAVGPELAPPGSGPA
ncbi:MAG: ATP-binding protein, partial [Actinomycetota bacterium]